MLAAIRDAKRRDYIETGSGMKRHSGSGGGRSGRGVPSEVVLLDAVGRPRGLGVCSHPSLGFAIFASLDIWRDTQRESECEKQLGGQAEKLILKAIDRR